MTLLTGDAQVWVTAWRYAYYVRRYCPLCRRPVEADALDGGRCEACDYDWVSVVGES